MALVDASGAPDVVGDDEPRRGWLLVLGLVVVLAAGVTISTVREDRAADRVAAEELQLSTDSAPVHPRPAGVGLVEVAVRNDGSTAVRVLTARLVAEGYRTERVDQGLDPGARLVLALKDGAACAATMADNPAESVELRVRTVRGTTITRAVALSPAAFREVNRAARARCGYLPADESFTFAADSDHLAPGSAVISARVSNRSLLPVQLTRLLPLTGLALTVDPALPLDLPTLTSATSRPRQVTLRITLTVKDCRTFLQSYLRNVGQRAEFLRGWLVQERTSVFEVPVLSFDPESSFMGPVDPSTIATHLLKACPQT